MRRSLKLFTVSAALLLGVGGLVSCGEDESMIIEVAGPGSQQALIQELIDDFKASNEDAAKYTWRFRDMGEDQVESQVPDPAKGPEVFHFSSDKLANLFKLNLLQGISKDSTYGKWIAENNTETALGFAEFAGRYYAYPYAEDNTYVLFYDSSKLTVEDVATYEGLIAKLTELSADLPADAKKYQVAYPWGTSYYSTGVMFTYGARYNVEYDNTTGALTNVTADFDTEKGLKAGKVLLQFKKDEAYVVDQGDAIPTQSGSENIIASVTGTWNVSKLKEELGDNYAVATLPTITIDGDTKTLGSFLGAKLMGVNAAAIGTDETKAAVCHAFAQYATGKDAQIKRHEMYGTGGTNIEFRQTDAFKNDPAQQAVAKQTELGNAVLQTNVPGKLWDAFTAVSADIKSGTTTEANLADALVTANNVIQTSR